MTCHKRILRAFALLCLFAARLLPAQSSAAATLAGTVLDPSGAAIPHATVHLHNDAADVTATADDVGHFVLRIPPGTYDLSADASGFRTYTRSAVSIQQHNQPLNLTLEIEVATEEVDVPSHPALSTESSANRDALVFTGDKLDAFSDDPAVMQEQIQALAGIDPTDPPQLYIDGFSGGSLPPKNTIREIRINQNPFSAFWDQFGGSRIEVFTKPGANQLHGAFDLTGTGEALNAKNPYITGSQPPYTTSFFNGNINGPLGKKTSFFLAANRYDLENNAVVNAVVLDPNNNPANLSQAVPNPSLTQTYSARIDRQFGAHDTLLGRYIFTNTSLTNGGVGQFVLPTAGFSSNTRSQTLQLTETHLFGAKVVLDSGFQYVRTQLRQDPNSNATSIVVQGAFTDGGASSQALHDTQDKLEFQEYFSITHGAHFIRTGMRYRLLNESNTATAGYNGQFLFPDLSTYEAGAPTQFSLSAGNPNASVLSNDIGLYAEDEWKLRQNFTFMYGLRFEHQTAIPINLDFGPRLGFAWSIAPSKKTKQPLFVLRGGGGIFYQRFPATNILQSMRQDGINQQVYYVTNPDFYPTVPRPPSLASTPPTIYQIDPHLHSPEIFQMRFTLEHSFGKYGSIAVDYGMRRSINLFESRNINAPLPGTYDPADPSSGIRPMGGSQNIYQYSSDGISNARTVSINPNINVTKNFMFWAYYTIGHQESDVTPGGGFPSNSYDLGDDAGRLNGFAQHQLYCGLNAKPGWNTAINVFMAVRSSGPFNITVAQDLNGDTIYNDRPAFATDLTRPSVVHTAYGTFDTAPIPGQTIIPINYADGPSLLYTELNLQKNFLFGPRPAPAAAHSASTKDLPPPRYRLSFAVGIDNPLNHVNPGPPIGVLGSPYFGQSTSLNSNFTNSSGANRVIHLRTAFAF
jgi:Carboxypeptidase regulatory-like domain/TonB dependent receptor